MFFSLPFDIIPDFKEKFKSKDLILKETSGKIGDA
jgi:hypothetical protein